MYGFVACYMRGSGPAARGVRTFQDQDATARFRQGNSGGKPIGTRSDYHGIELLSHVEGVT